MSEIQFAVSAKTARLIGRENISDVDGAVIELIKNSYDADATCACVLFDMPFPNVPRAIPAVLAAEVFDQAGMEQVLNYYDYGSAQLIKKSTLSVEEELCLERFLFSYNTITILDNGCGMDEEVLKHAWMNIGTSDKEQRKVSPGGRIKTGAKGIGRFALDKLSTKTVVYTQSSTDTLKKWQMDWTQFDTAQMLNEVHAELTEVSNEFQFLACKIAAHRIKSFENYSWETGTIITLSPTRDVWAEAFFKRINTNLSSLFPGSNESQFDIYISNKYYAKYNFENERFKLKANDYDYKISASFDGVDNLVVTITRNEIDTRKIKVQHEVGGVTHDLALSDFWARDAFQKANYKRADFAKTITTQFPAQKLSGIDAAAIRSVGAFECDLYFIKNTAGKIGITKLISPDRKNILQKYSGVKLYRDGFKVRPYGEEGPSFDWLNLGDRVTRSPGAVSSSSAWHVRTNQLIGAVRITKEGNPNLYDMANREGLAINDAYRAFVALLEKVIETFECDRQYVFREYTQWIRGKANELSKVDAIIEEVKNELPQSTPSQSGKKATTSNNETGQNDSVEDYKQAIRHLSEEKARQEKANRTMMLFSSAGVMTNTFSHEIGRIMTDAGSRMQQLRVCIEYLLGDEHYTGDPDFDPFPVLNQVEETDQLLENWLSVVMAGVSENKFAVADVNLSDSLNRIIGLWSPLLEKKLITINPIQSNNLSADTKIPFAEIDLYIILNNFFLNSAWFLERATSTDRRIDISISVLEHDLIMVLENNGPALDARFANKPNSIFEAGVTSKDKEKKEGTGLGLWIVKTIVDDNYGQIQVLDKHDGFGLRISIPR